MKSSKTPSVKVSTDEQERCRKVVDKATPRGLDVLQAFANGLSPKQVALLLNITEKTVEMYTRYLRELCHQAWDLSFDERLPNGFLYATFAAFFQYEIGNAEEELDKSLIPF